MLLFTQDSLLTARNFTVFKTLLAISVLFLLMKRQNQKRKKKFISCKLLFIHYQLSYCILRPNDSVSSISNVSTGLDSLPLDFHFYLFLSVDTTTMPIIVVIELGLTTTIYIICLFKREYLFTAPTVGWPMLWRITTIY